MQVIVCCGMIAAALAAPGIANGLKAIDPIQQGTDVSGAAQTGTTTSSGRQAPATPTVRTTTRLVEVGVIAYDKHRHAVTDLTQSDFEIYDNGRPEQIKYFSGSSEPASASVAASPKDSPASLGNAQNSQRGSDASTTILLIDSNNLAWQDLSYARQQMLEFLKKLPQADSIGLYVLRSDRIEVLCEPAHDHSQVAAILEKWMPNIQELARAQEADRTNRQQFDNVHSVNDLVNVNGSARSAQELYAPIESGTQNTVDVPSGRPLDPQLRRNSASPDRVAYALLAVAARHLASHPGHKSLVWITSDTALLDWTNKPENTEKGMPDDRIALRAQEALNEAHVSLYPLDASALESGAVGAGMENQNVQAVGLTARGERGAYQGSGLDPGRVTAQAQRDVLPIRGVFRAMAAGTGGQVFRRSSDLSSELSSVIADGRSIYLLSFVPDTEADGSYHALSVKLTNRRGVTLRYRTGYLYTH